MAERAGLAFTSYESAAEGKLELVDGKFQFTAITLRPTIMLPANANAAKAKELIEEVEANCLISNSIKAKVSLESCRYLDRKERAVYPCVASKRVMNTSV